VFALVQHHKYSISEVECLIPFERDIYLGMLNEYLRKVEEARQKN
jgi:hypothetical protein